MTKILVVEDDEKISKALNIRLSFDGYEVSRAFDAIAALNMLKEDQPDLVLLDISIPGGNGLPD